jgi:hypothetical protein
VIADDHHPARVARSTAEKRAQRIRSDDSPAMREPVALAFERFEGTLRVRREDVLAAEHRGGELVREVVRAGDEARSIIDVPALLARISAAAGK